MLRISDANRKICKKDIGGVFCSKYLLQLLLKYIGMIKNSATNN